MLYVPLSSQMFVRHQLNVQAYHGGEGGDGSDMDGVNVAICTIEKANSIVNRLAEEKRLQVSSRASVSR